MPRSREATSILNRLFARAGQAALSAALLCIGAAPAYPQAQDTWVYKSSSTIFAAYGSGASIVRAGDRLYAVRGGNRDFAFYDIAGDQWTSTTTLPGTANVAAGGALVWAGGDYIYAFRGGNGGEFLRYQISISSWLSSTTDWVTVATAPAVPASGAALVWDGGNNIYAFQGGSTAFWRYSISGNTWDSSLATFSGGTGAGAGLAWDGTFVYGMSGLNFRRYTVGSPGSWANLASPPSTATAASGIVFASTGLPVAGDYVFYNKGGTASQDFYRYQISAGSWTVPYPSSAPSFWGANSGRHIEVYGDYIFGFQAKAAAENGLWQYKWNDTDVPGGISDLAASSGASDGAIQLSWTAPGDDGSTGNIAGGQFVIKHSAVQIITSADFDSPGFAVSTVTVSTSVTAGSAQSSAIAGLNPGTTYWFAIKTRDENSANFSVWNSSADPGGVNTLAWGPAADLAPSTATAVSVTGRGPTYVSLSWTAPAPDPGDISHYELHYGTTSAVYTGTSTIVGQDSPVNVGNVASYTLSGLATGATYYLALRTVDSGPNVLSSAFSTEVSTLTQASSPGAPASFAGVALSTYSVRWDWALVPGATAYRLQTSSGGLVAQLSDPTSFYLQTGLTADASSQIVQVQAFNAFGAGGVTVDPSTPVYTLAEPPSNASYVSVSSSAVTITWNENSNPAATDYEVSQSTDGFSANFSTPVAFGSAQTSNTATLSGLQAGTSYSFRVRAQNRDGIVTSFLVFSATTTSAAPLSGVVISEIMYNPAGTETNREWIEIYNSSNAPVDLTGWSLFEAGTDKSLVPAQGGSILGAGAFAVIASSATAFLADFSSDPSSSTWIVLRATFSSLTNSGETLALKDATSVVQSSLTYTGSTPWPTSTDGRSIERISAAGLDTDPTNWSLGPSSGTPAAANTASPDTTPPAAISNLTALAGTNDGAIELSWTSPGDDGTTGNIAGGQFLIKYTSAGIISDFDNPPAGTSLLTLSTSAVSGSAQSHSLTGLLPGASYWFALVARDEKTSNFSTWTSSGTNPAVNTLAFSPAQDLAPGSPQGVQVLSRGPQFVQLSWTAPSPDPGDIASYELHYGTASGVYAGTSTILGQDSPVNVGNVLTHTLSGLAVNTSYYFTLKTVDTSPGVLRSGFSSEVSTFTELAAPGAPAAFTGAALSTASIRWDWSLPAGATSYQLQTSTGGLVAQLSDPTSFYVQTGLTPDTSSQIIRVQAWNAAGGGGTTNAAAPVYTLAAAPSGGSYVAVTTHSVQLTWLENGNAAATDYEVSYSTDGFVAHFGTAAAFGSGLTAAPYTATGLLPQRTYTFRVRAQNRDGLATAFHTLASTDTSSPAPSGVVINEIMYNPFGTDTAHEWIELYNSSDTAVDLSGWTLYDATGTGVSGNNLTLTLSQGSSMLAAGGLAIFAANPANFLTDYAGFSGSATWTIFDISGSPSFASGDTLAVKDSLGVVQSTVAYSASSPWPVIFEGESIERISATAPDNDPANWSFGPSSGTPGSTNSVTPEAVPPAAISDLTALTGANDGEITLSWTSPGDDGASGTLNGAFIVGMTSVSIINDANNPPPGTTGFPISTSAVAGSAQSIALTGGDPGVFYWFAIVAADDNSNFSVWTSSVTDPSVNTLAGAAAGDSAPAAPSLGAVTSFNQALSVPFSAPSPDPGDIVSYRVYQATYAFASASDPGVTTTTYANTSAAHTATSLTNGVTVYFRVQAVDAGPNFLTSALSAAVSGVPRIRAPATLSASHLGSAVGLSWSASGDAGAGNFGGYNVYRSTASGGPYASLASAVGATTYSDSASISSTSTYFYVVRSSDNATAGAFAESADSPQATASPDSVPPAITHEAVSFVVFRSTSLTLTASVRDFRDAGGTLAGVVQSMTLSYRVLGGTGAFATAAFAGSGFGTATATGTAAVPVAFLQSAAAAGGFTYFISATDGANTGLSPSAGVHTAVVEGVVTSTVGTGGGTVTSAGGFIQVVITPNALSGNVPVTVSPLETASVPAGTPGDAVPVKDSYTGRPLTAGEFGPTGLEFQVPVQIRLKFLDTDGDGYPEVPPGGNSLELPNTPDFHADQLRIYLLSGGRWVQLGGRREGDRIAVRTKHFSTYGLFPASFAAAARPAERFVTPNGDGVNDAVTFGPTALRVTVYDMTGREVWSGTGDGVTAVQWPGTDAHGRVMESGAYLYRAEGGGDTHGVVVVVR